MEGKYLLLGTNLGDRFNNLQNAVDALLAKDIDIIRSSSVYESEPWGIREQPSFYNAVVEVNTELDPNQLLTTCLAVEKEMGRERLIKWGERIIDIDILYYDHMVVDENDLKIPHPGIPDRRFTLTPLVELASDFTHPILKRDQEALLRVCDDELDCTVLDLKLSI